MHRRTFLSAMTGILLAAPLAAEAQQAENVPRLCFLTFSPGIPLSRFDPFFQGLRDRGYVDGQTITIDYLSAEGQAERFPTLAADCLRRKAGHHRCNHHRRRSGCEEGNPHHPDREKRRMLEEERRDLEEIATRGGLGSPDNTMRGHSRETFV